MNESTYTIIENIKCYAPELAYQNEGFPPDSHDRLAILEEQNFWFKARNLILIHLFKKYVGKGSSKKVMEIGSGNGYVLKGLCQLEYTLIGTEIYLDGLKNIRKKLPHVELIQLDALQMPFISEFDAIGAFDVIEHIQEDEKVIQNVHKALKPDGYFLITVPQHRFLWSYTDDYARHKRRYTRNELKYKLSKNKFRICFISSFVFTPFVFVLISRLMKKNKPVEKITRKDIESEFLIPEWLNKLFYLLIMVDYYLIKASCSLPFGSSLVVVARKV